MSRTIAAADVGGTHARFALAEISDGQVLSLGEPITLPVADYDSFQLAWREFGRLSGVELPSSLALAFAGPVGGDELKLTNSSWVIRPGSLEGELGIRQFNIVNDFGAIAHAVAQLGPAEFDHLCGPDGPMPDRAVTTIMGPGTGLGVAQLVKTGDDYRVIETEGGHVGFAPLDAVEDRILAILRARFGRVSVERIACGSGLGNLYDALAIIKGAAVNNYDDKAIWTAATKGSDPVAVMALDRFFLTLGSVAGDLALAHGANAVVIAGGLGYRLKHRFADSGFAGRYLAKGRFSRRMENIPVKLLNHLQPGLFGAAAAFARECP